MAKEPLNISDLQSQFQTRIELLTNQNTPNADKAYNIVYSAAEAMLAIQVSKSNDKAAKEAFIISASEVGLQVFADQLNLPRNAATAAQITATHPGINGTTIPIDRRYTGTINGLKYTTNDAYDVESVYATITLTCVETGTDGNLSIGDTLEIETPLSGLTGTTATITAIDAIAAEQEDIEEWRQRLLDKNRNPGSGSTPSACRNFAQEVEGVARAYPYRGDLVNSILKPFYRTMFVEASTTIDPDGIAPQALLDQVRQSIRYDSNGIARQDLGLTNESLIVASIYRTTIYVTINGLTWQTGKEAQTKSALDNVVKNFLRSRRPWIEGCDPDFEQSQQTVSTFNLSDEISPILDKYQAECSSISFGISTETTIANYDLQAGELIDLDPAGIDYT